MINTRLKANLVAVTMLSLMLLALLVLMPKGSSDTPQPISTPTTYGP